MILCRKLNILTIPSNSFLGGRTWIELGGSTEEILYLNRIASSSGDSVTIFDSLHVEAPWGVVPMESELK